jgi:hypothetical protein
MRQTYYGVFLAILGLLVTTFSGSNPPAAPSTPEWSVEGRWRDTCSCAIPCPCWKKEVPTLGHCSEMFFFHIDKGHYGTTNLDGIELVQVASSGEGKPTAQSRKDKDYEISNLYISKSLSREQAEAVEVIFTRLAFSGAIAKNHATKRVDLRTQLGDDWVKVEIPGILQADVKMQKDSNGQPKPFPYPTTIHPMLGPGIQGESVVFEFHDDGFSWKFQGRQGTFANFSYSTDRGPLPWESAAK